MHWAAYNDNLSVVKYLVEHGGDVNAKKTNVGNLVPICCSVVLLHAVIHFTMFPPPVIMINPPVFPLC